MSSTYIQTTCICLKKYLGAKKSRCIAGNVPNALSNAPNAYGNAPITHCYGPNALHAHGYATNVHGKSPNAHGNASNAHGNACKCLLQVHSVGYLKLFI